MLRTLILVFLFTLSLTLKSNDQNKLEKLIVENKFTEVSKILKKKTSLSWMDYFLESVSFYQQGLPNEAILSGVKSLALNPFSNHNNSNLMLIEKENGASGIKQIKNASVTRFVLIVSIVILMLLCALCVRKRKVVIFFSLVQICIVITVLLHPRFSKIGNIEQAAIQKEGDEYRVRVSPSIDSNVNSKFGNKEILFIGRSIGDWYYVENIFGEPGWVNKNHLIL